MRPVNHATLISDLINVIGISPAALGLHTRNVYVPILTAVYLIVLLITILYPATLVTAINGSKLDKEFLSGFHVCALNSDMIYLSGFHSITMKVPITSKVAPTQLEIASIVEGKDHVLGSLPFRR